MFLRMVGESFGARSEYKFHKTTLLGNFDKYYQNFTLVYNFGGSRDRICVYTVPNILLNSLPHNRNF